MIEAQNSKASLAAMSAVCMLNAGMGEAAEKLILAANGSADAGSMQFYLAQAYAQQGKIDLAVSTLTSILRENRQHRAASNLALELLRIQAIQKINANDHTGAGAALGAAMEIDPSDPDRAALMARVENVLPVAYVNANKREAAAVEWEKALRQDASNGRVTHSLCLLYLFWAMDADNRNEISTGASQKTPENKLWRTVIAYWVLLENNEQFWITWAAQRKSAYSIPDVALAELKNRWHVDLESRLSALGEMTEAGSNTRYAWRRKLEQTLWIERTAAVALRELTRSLCPHCKQPTLPIYGASGKQTCAECSADLSEFLPAHDVPCCGPLMLGVLGLEARAKSLEEPADKRSQSGARSGPIAELKLPFLGGNADVLRRCLSPLNKVLALIVAGDFEEAVSAIGSDKSPDAVEYYQFASFERGKREAGKIPSLEDKPTEAAVQAYLKPVKAAIKVWVEAFKFSSSSTGMTQTIAKAIEDMTIRASNELKSASTPFTYKSEKPQQWDREIAMLSAAIELVKEAIAIQRSDRLIGTAAALIQERAASYTMAPGHGMTKAIADLEEGLKIAPNDAAMKTRLSGYYNRRGCETDGATAIQAFTRAIELNPTSGRYYANRGIQHMNNGNRTRGLEDLTKAMQIDPSLRAEIGKML